MLNGWRMTSSWCRPFSKSVSPSTFVFVLCAIALLGCTTCTHARPQYCTMTFAALTSFLSHLIKTPRSLPSLPTTDLHAWRAETSKWGTLSFFYGRLQTWQWLAPEVLDYRKTAGFSTSADIFSLGIVLWECLMVMSLYHRKGPWYMYSVCGVCRYIS